MNISIQGAREPHDDFWKQSEVLSSVKWTHNPFIIIYERSESSIIQEEITKLDGRIKVSELYTDPKGVWATSSYERERELYAKATQESKKLKKERAALVKKDGSKNKLLQVSIVETLQEALQYPDEGIVLKQWRGKWHSDFFMTRIGELRREFDKYECKE